MLSGIWSLNKNHCSWNLVYYFLVCSCSRVFIRHKTNAGTLSPVTGRSYETSELISMIDRRLSSPSCQESSHMHMPEILMSLQHLTAWRQLIEHWRKNQWCALSGLICLTLDEHKHVELRSVSQMLFWCLILELWEQTKYKKICFQCRTDWVD